MEGVMLSAAAEEEMINWESETKADGQKRGVKTGNTLQYGTGALICINSYLTNAQIIMS